MLDWETDTGESPNCWDVDAVGWYQFAQGWAAGIRSVGPLPLTPAIYLNKSEYAKEGVGTYGLVRVGSLPVIVAISQSSAAIQ